MIASLAQSLFWASLTSLPLFLVALAIGRLPVSVQVKVWVCRLAFLKPVLSLLPFGVMLGGMPRVSSDVVSPNRNFEILVLVLVAIWAAGFIVVVIDLYRGYLGSRSLVSSGTVAHDPGVARLSRRFGLPMPAVRRLNEPGLPFASGILHPMIVLPFGDCPESVVAHELAHLKAKDLAWNLMARLVLAVFWFTPFIHKLEAELSLWQEAAADLSACDITNCERKAHASAIVASVATTPPRFVLEAGLAGPGHLVARRLKALYGTRGSVAIGLLAIAMMLGAAIPLKLVGAASGTSSRVLAQRVPVAAPVTPIAGPVR